MKKTKKFLILLAVGMFLILAGGMMFVSGMSAENWDFQKLSNRPPYEERTREFENQNQSIMLSDKNVKIKIGKSLDDKIHITYFEREKEYYKITESDGIVFEKTDEYKWHEKWFVFDFASPGFTVLLPEGYTGNLDFKTTNGDIEAKNVANGEMSLKTTNGAVSLTDIDAGGAITIKSSNGKIDLTNVSANGRIDAVTTNGKLHLLNVDSLAEIKCASSNGNVNANKVHSEASVEFSTTNGKITAVNVDAGTTVTFRSSNGIASLSNITGSAIDLKTTNGRIEVEKLNAHSSVSLVSSNGSITGSITGQQSDFSITSRTSNGKNNLPGQSSGGAKTLNIKTSNGSIDIHFVAA